MKAEMSFEELQRMFSLKYELQRVLSENPNIPAVWDVFRTVTTILETATISQ